jgi:hypothetical protein
LTKVDQKEVLALAIKARDRLNASIATGTAAAKSMEPALAEMYFRLFDK